MTEKQAAFIKKLMEERNWTEYDMDMFEEDMYLRTGKTARVNCSENMSSSTASRLIERLLACETKADANRRSGALAKHAKFVEWAKGAGIKGVRRNMCSRTIREKIITAGIEIPAEYANMGVR